MKSQVLTHKLQTCTSLAPRGRKLKNSTDEEKHQRRLASNRKSAFKSRYRKKVIIEELQKKKQHLIMQIETIRRQNLLLNQIISELECTKAPDRVVQSNYVTTMKPQQNMSRIASPALSSPQIISSGVIQPLFPISASSHLDNFITS